MDSCGLLTLDELDLLLLTIESESYSPDLAQSLFSEFADVVDGPTDLLSLAKFAALATRHRLFTPRAQAALIGKSTADGFQTQVRLLREVYPSMRAVLKKRLTLSQQYNELWESRLSEYEKRLQNNDYTAKCTALL